MHLPHTFSLPLFLILSFTAALELSFWISNISSSSPSPRFAFHFAVLTWYIFTCSQINRWRNGSHHHSLCYWHFTNISIQHPSPSIAMLAGFGKWNVPKPPYRQQTHTQTYIHNEIEINKILLVDGFWSMRTYFSLFGSRSTYLLALQAVYSGSESTSNIYRKP